ncbi:MAG: zinc ribbon-containing protein [Gammaproteobacteria bacterium]|nr:zinc ribbon-containing protein [Gammaproteobacteria bacterium]
MNEQTDRLLKAFNHMVEELHAAVEKAEETLSPTVDEMVQNAEKITRNLYALTTDEAKSITAQLKRDITHARDYMQTEGKEFNAWLNFDIQQVEDRFVDFLSQAADKTWLDFRTFEILSKQNSIYKTGEICSAGTLRCMECSQEMKFTKNSRIPPCPKCHHTRFERQVK